MVTAGYETPSRWARTYDVSRMHFTNTVKDARTGRHRMAVRKTESTHLHYQGNGHEAPDVEPSV